MKMLPRLLDQSMNEVIRIDALSLALNLSSDTLSTAQMQVREGDYDVNIGDWVELFTPTESAGIFRVVAIDTDYKAKLCEISLEHGLGTLADRVILGKLDSHGINGKDKASVAAIITKLLSFQSLWELDECEFEDQFSFSFENANVFDCIKDVGKAVGNYLFSFDQSSLPWKLSILDKPTDEAASCEMRMDRNIDTMRVTLDRTDMATRIYPYGKDGITIASVNDDVAYVEKNVDQWGLVEMIYTDSKLTDKAELKSAAEVMLDQRCQPIATVSIDGYALAQATGEPLDDLKIGRVCRMPITLKDHSHITMNERIISLSWQDVLNQPTVVAVTLANRRETASSLAAEASATATETATAMQQENGEIHATITDLNGDLTQLDVDIGGIRTRVEDAEGNISTVTQTANAVETEVRDARGNFASLSLKVQDMVSSIDLKADIITLNGYVKMTEFEAEKGRLDQLLAGTLMATGLVANGGSFGRLTASTYASLHGVFVENVSCGPKTLKIGESTCTFFAPADATFELSDMPGYAEALRAAKSEGASGVTIAAADITSEGGEAWYRSTKQIYVNVRAEASNGEYNTNRVAVDASDAYWAGASDGYDDGEDDVTCTGVRYAYEAGGLYVTVSLSNGKSSTMQVSGY